MPSKVLLWTHGFVVVRVLLADLGSFGCWSAGALSSTGGVVVGRPGICRRRFIVHALVFRCSFLRHQGLHHQSAGCTHLAGT